jgi:hypothetical protein
MMSSLQSENIFYYLIPEVDLQKKSGYFSLIIHDNIT